MPYSSPKYTVESCTVSSNAGSLWELVLDESSANVGRTAVNPASICIHDDLSPLPYDPVLHLHSSICIILVAASNPL